MMEEIKKHISEIKTMMENHYYHLKYITESIIQNKETNIHKIELTLDMLLNCYYYVNEAKVSFFKLCDYLETLDKEAAIDYREIFEQDFGEELRLKKTSN